METLKSLLSISLIAIGFGNQMVNAAQPSSLEGKNKSALKAGKIKLMSLETGLCLQPDGHNVKLGDCNDNASVAQLAEQGKTYSISFGGQVLEIPDESKSEGHQVGLWSWNGETNQQMILNKIGSEEETTVTIQFAHSNYYVQTNGSLIQQGPMSESKDAYWRIIDGDKTQSEAASQETACNVRFEEGRLYINHLESITDTKKCIMSLYTTKGQCIYRSEMTTDTPYVDINLESDTYIIRLEGDKQMVTRIKA